MISFVKTTDEDYFLDAESIKNLPDKSILRQGLSNLKNKTLEPGEEFKGANCKIWLTDKNNKSNSFLFKSNVSNDNQTKPNLMYGEIIIGHICDHVGLDHTNYHLCQICDNIGKQICVGTLSANYRKNIYDTELSAKNISDRYKNSMYNNNHGRKVHMELNTVYEYIKQINFMYSNRLSKNEIEDIKQYMLKIALLDYLTIQVDRHNGNYGCMYVSSKGIKSATYIPIYDNECCFFLHKRPEKIGAFLQRLSDNRVKEKDKLKQINALAAGKDSTPILGIYTSIVELGSHGEFIKKKNTENKTNLEIFINELAEEILQNNNLAKFYDKLKIVNIENLNKNNDIPNDIAHYANILFNKRVEMLESALTYKILNEFNQKAPKNEQQGVQYEMH